MLFDIQSIETDVLILGGGGAAGMAAARAAESGARVVLAAKTSYPGGSTIMARGGWQAAVGHSNPQDNPSLHVRDTLSVGCGINIPELVEVMAQESVSALAVLDRYGATFAREADGRFAQKNIQGVTYPRHIHNYDQTGKGLADGLKGIVQKNDNIKIMNHLMAVHLFVSDGRIQGALLYHDRTGELYAAQAKTVILATGGGSAIFAVHDNLTGTTGDGYVLGLDAGLELLSMEMVEFQLCVCHPPSMMRYPPNSSAWVIRGGRLYNGQGERFMKAHDPVKLEANTRAAINRAVAIEIACGRGTASGGVYLDLSDIPLDTIKEIGPTIYSAFKKHDIDLTYQPMELSQGAHSFLGGIAFNARSETAIGGLYVAGEVGGGVHGANRMGGNQLSDALSFGLVAGGSAAEYASAHKAKALNQSEVRAQADKFKKFIIPEKPDKDLSLSESAASMRQTISKSVGPIRADENIKEGIRRLAEMEDRLPRIPAQGANPNEAVRFKWEARSIAKVGQAIGLAVQYRKESRGVHYREDHPQQDDRQFKGLTVIKTDPEWRVEFRPL